MSRVSDDENVPEIFDRLAEDFGEWDANGESVTRVADLNSDRAVIVVKFNKSVFNERLLYEAVCALMFAVRGGRKDAGRRNIRTSPPVPGEPAEGP